VISGRSGDGSLVEMVELRDHPWFVACQFHPEFTSTPRDGHPLFVGFIRAACARNEQRKQHAGSNRELARAGTVAPRPSVTLSEAKVAKIKTP